ncbi:MAG: M18 family aminopeptidase [Acidiferrobacterales bacterium]|nr:M18 family aminopeptidase [Acidiferrobacterales bacterium]
MKRSDMATVSTAESPQLYGDSIADFIHRSPSPYHASSSLADLLESAGFIRLSEQDKWSLESGGKYYVTRNDTSLIAFRCGRNPADSAGIRAIGAHLDSPCLKLAPDPVLKRHGYRQLNVEVYGSPLLRTWFDRDLSIAGRIFFDDGASGIRKCLIHKADPLAVIPSIAIHLERDANVRQEVDSQAHLNPVIADDVDSLEAFLSVGEDLTESGYDSQRLLGHDLSLYDVNPPERLGTDGLLISSARIDNLLSCHAGAIAIAEAQTDNFCLLVCSDHEEVGSMSDSGADGPFLASVLQRTVGLDPTVIGRSLLVSADGAHGIHPNYPHKHDEQHAPAIGGGPVIKVNANQNYASSGESIACIRKLCESINVPHQVFISRNDIRCGTTIGPIVASEIGIPTVDIGVAQFAMHSIRELASVVDALGFRKLLQAVLESEKVNQAQWTGT